MEQSYKASEMRNEARRTAEPVFHMLAEEASQSFCPQTTAENQLPLQPLISVTQFTQTLIVTPAPPMVSDTRCVCVRVHVCVWGAFV